MTTDGPPCLWAGRLSRHSRCPPEPLSVTLPPVTPGGRPTRRPRSPRAPNTTTTAGISTAGVLPLVHHGGPSVLRPGLEPPTSVPSGRGVYWGFLDVRDSAPVSPPPPSRVGSSTRHDGVVLGTTRPGSETSTFPECVRRGRLRKEPGHEPPHIVCGSA